MKLKSVWILASLLVIAWVRPARAQEARSPGQPEKLADLLAESERNNKVRELSNLTREFQRNERSFREDVNLRKNEELASLQERADKIIKQIADVEKFDLILQEPVVWASPRIDITDRVIKLLADR